MLVSPFVRLTLQSKVVSVTSYAVSQMFVNSVAWEWINHTTQRTRRRARAEFSLTINEIWHGGEISLRGEEHNEACPSVDERPECRPIACSK